jgi:hypothetical protein
VNRTIADEARDSAINCEMVKYAYRQTRDGVVVSFVVHPNDVPIALQRSAIGARYVVALVELSDDETPKEVTKPAPRPRQDVPQVNPDGAKRDWNELQPAQQAGIRCNEATFAAFLKENRPDDWHEASSPAECVRLICGVHSRVELGTNQKARVIWTQLDKQYQAWLAMERVGA